MQAAVIVLALCVLSSFVLKADVRGFGFRVYLRVEGMGFSGLLKEMAVLFSKFAGFW